MTLEYYVQPMNGVLHRLFTSKAKIMDVSDITINGHFFYCGESGEITLSIIVLSFIKICDFLYICVSY